MAIEEKVIIDKAYLVHAELLNLDFEQNDIKKFIRCLDNIDNKTF